MTDSEREVLWRIETGMTTVADAAIMRAALAERDRLQAQNAELATRLAGENAERER